MPYGTDYLDSDNYSAKPKGFMATGTIKTSTWDIVGQEVYSGTYGKVYLSVNRTSHIAIARFSGNATAPSTDQTVTVNIASYCSALTESTFPTRNGGYISASIAGKIYVYIKSRVAWEAGSVVFAI